MTYYYVKHTGTATGSAGTSATPRTGSFGSMSSSEVYRDILTLVSTYYPSSGDIICISNANDYTHVASSGNTYWSFQSLINGKGISVISVSDTDADIPAAGAKISFSITGSATYAGAYWCFEYVFGIEMYLLHDSTLGSPQLFLSGSTTDYTQSNHNVCVFDTCTFKSYASLYNGQIHISGIDTLYRNCIFDLSEDSLNASIVRCDYNEYNNHEMTFLDCTFIDGSAVTSTSPVFYMDLNDAFFIKCIGCDFSAAACYILPFAASGYHEGGVILDRCTLNSLSLPSFSADAHYRSGQNAVVYNCEYNSTSPYSRVESILYKYQSNTSIYRNGGSVNEAGEEYCLEIKIPSTFTQVQSMSPAIIKISEAWVKSSGQDRYVSVYIARANGSSPLTRNDVWLCVGSGGLSDPAGTYGVTHDYANPLSITSSDLPSDTSSWTGLSNPVTQKITCKVPALSEPGLFTVYLAIAVNNTTLYADAQVEFA